MRKLVVLLAVLTMTMAAQAGMRITEWMYDGRDGEFIEFTNMGTTAIDMSGWSYDDDSRTAGTFDLSGFGLVGVGETVILCESAADDFRLAWGLSASVKIVGESSSNISKADEINLYDASDVLTDRLTYNNVDNPVTKSISGNILKENLGLNNASLAVLSSDSDIYKSFFSIGDDKGKDLGNPGSYYAAVPEPATLVLLGLGSLLFVRRR